MTLLYIVVNIYCINNYTRTHKSLILKHESNYYNLIIIII